MPKTRKVFDTDSEESEEEIEMPKTRKVLDADSEESEEEIEMPKTRKVFDTDSEESEEEIEMPKTKGWPKTMVRDDKGRLRIGSTLEEEVDLSGPMKKMSIEDEEEIDLRPRTEKKGRSIIFDSEEED
jgi:hypothetical protein